MQQQKREETDCQPPALAGEQMIRAPHIRSCTAKRSNPNVKLRGRHTDAHSTLQTISGRSRIEEVLAGQVVEVGQLHAQVIPGNQRAARVQVLQTGKCERMSKQRNTQARSYRCLE
jgi:hypothetical protein